MKVYNKLYNFDTLRNYALWYFYKYLISPNRLKNKLLEKTDDLGLVAEVYDSIEHLIDEKTLIIDKINIYLIRNKNINYIKNSLKKGLFDDNLTKELLKSYLGEESLLNKGSLIIKINNYKNKNKSINYIKNKLIERKEDEKIVLECIEEVFGLDDNENLKNEIDKLNKKNLDKNKIIQKLLLKGFNYGEIKNILN